MYVCQTFVMLSETDKHRLSSEYGGISIFMFVECSPTIGGLYIVPSRKNDLVYHKGEIIENI